MIEFCTFVRNIASPTTSAQLEVQIQITGVTIKAGSQEFATPPMVTDNEVDEYVDLIIENLEKVRREAKAKLSEN